MRHEDIGYEADGLDMIGHLVVDESRTTPGPAVLVSHEGGGLDDHAKGKAERLAALGYVVFALDYHGGGARPPREQAMAHLQAIRQDPDRIRAIGRAGLDLLLAQEATDPARVAAIGFCFGGTLSLELARGGADLKAVVGFHSGLSTPRPADARNIVGSVLVCIGSEDPIVTPEQRAGFEQEMRDAGVDWRLDLYGGAGHSFTNPAADELGLAGFGYDASTDERSWRAMIDLFDERFGRPDA
jgi:dienelactone hydrolase